MCPPADGSKGRLAGTKQRENTPLLKPIGLFLEFRNRREVEDDGKRTRTHELVRGGNGGPG